MVQEIELKFIVNYSVVEVLCDYFNMLGGEYYDFVQLLNIYYEMLDNWLCGYDMGLRICGENGCYEMIMKVVGRVIGGLYQCSEYNVALSESMFDLVQLSTEVWLNGELFVDFVFCVQLLFSIDFYCEKWLVVVDGS